METFVVEIERTEKYYMKVRVKAKDEQEARRKVIEFDNNNGLENQWNELDPIVSTEYTPYSEAYLIDGEEEGLIVVE